MIASEYNNSEPTKSGDEVGHENLEKDTICIYRNYLFDFYRLFYLYGGSIMTDNELKKDFDKLFDSDIKIDCWENLCELRNCCECHIYSDAFEEYKNERKKT